MAASMLGSDMAAAAAARRLWFRRRRRCRQGQHTCNLRRFRTRRRRITRRRMRSVKLVLVGAGQVGQDLLRLLLQSRAAHAAALALRIEVAALGDSSGFLAHSDAAAPLSDADVEAAIAWKQSGKQFKEHALFAFDSSEEFLQRVDESCVVVDTSASGNEALHQLLVQCLQEKHARVVFANKKPLTASLEIFTALNAPQDRVRVGFESTVCAGTPVIAALNRVLASGDKVISMKGALSGTLGYISSQLQAGGSFSDIVIEAHRLGYTEPDPRDDLGGIDVARKALILARLGGLTMDMENVSIEALYPDELADVPLEEFMSRLPQLNQLFADKVAEAGKRGQVLRYVASIHMEKCSNGGLQGEISVGMVGVDSASPLGSLHGTDNLLELDTAVYSDAPLVIRGSGAGARVTSAGVLADIVNTAFVV